MAEEPIAPEVFDFIDDFLGHVSVYAVAGSAPLDSESNVLAFCENFFAQFFENDIGDEITSISSVSSSRAGIHRRRLPGKDPRRRLIRDFQHLCKVHSDLIGETYGSGGDERAEFFYSDLPDLLHDIEQWAREAGHDTTRDRVRRTIRKYREFVDQDPTD